MYSNKKSLENPRMLKFYDYSIIRVYNYKGDIDAIRAGNLFRHGNKTEIERSRADRSSSRGTRRNDTLPPDVHNMFQRPALVRVVRRGGGELRGRAHARGQSARAQSQSRDHDSRDESLGDVRSRRRVHRSRGLVPLRRAQELDLRMFGDELRVSSVRSARALRHRIVFLRHTRRFRAGKARVCAHQCRDE